MPDFDEIVSRELQDSRFCKSGLVTWSRAERIINDWFREWWLGFERQMSAFQTYRGWQGKRTAYRIYLKFWTIAHAQLYANLYPQNRKRVGMQPVQTRNWRPKEKRGGVEFGMFNGKPAWRRRPGRPALSESEWLKREAARIRFEWSKNKTNIKHKDRKPLPTKAPPTILPRPTTGETFGKETKGKPHDTSPGSFQELRDMFKEKLIDEVKKQIEDAVKDWAKEKAEKFTAHIIEMLKENDKMVRQTSLDDMATQDLGRVIY